MNHHVDPAARDRYIAAEMTVEEEALVAHHLAACAPCRRAVAAEEGLRIEARALPVLQPRPETLDRIRTSIATGVLVATAAPAPRSSGRGAGWALLMAAAAVLAGVLLVGAPANHLEAGSDTGELHFSSSLIAPGATVGVTYTPPASLKGEDSLVLRVRMRTAGHAFRRGGSQQQRIAVMKRGKGGRFTASIAMPDSIVYAAFAVEDGAGNVIDHNRGRLWQVWAASKPGVMSEAARQQQAYDEMSRDWTAALATLRAAAAAHPDNPWRWAILRASEPETDSALEVHRSRLRELDRRLRPIATLDSAQQAAMVLYSTLELFRQDGSMDSTILPIAEYWRGRLLRESPAHTRAVEVTTRLLAAQRTAGAEAAMDSIWDAVPSARATTARSGWWLAQGMKDDALKVKWGSRYATAGGGLVRDQVVQVGRIPAGFDWALRSIDSMLVAMDGDQDERRDLTETRRAFADRQARERDRWIVARGALRVQHGDAAGGRADLVRGSAAHWDPQVYRQIRQASERVGDSSMVVAMVARVIADPLTAAAERAQLDSIGRQWSPSQDAWSAAKARADSAFVERTGAGLSNRLAPASAYAALGLESDAAPTLVVFWSAACPYSRDDLPAIARWYAANRSRGARVAMVSTQGADAYAHRVLAGAGLADVRQVTDRDQAVTFAFRSLGTPSYVVLDGRRIVTDATPDLGEAVRSIELALRRR